MSELILGPANYKGTLDTSGEGAGGVWIPGKRAMAPIVWRFPWPEEVKQQLVTNTNPDGDITNSDLKMEAEVLGWLVLEAVVPTWHAHVGACSENSPTVAWQTTGASKRSDVANWLLRVLAVRLHRNRASPLVTQHMAGDENRLGDILPRSFGYKAEWYFEEDNIFYHFSTQLFHFQIRILGQGFASAPPCPQNSYANW